MRVLFDTNIFIYREDYQVVRNDLSELLRIFNKLSVNILIHPRSKEEINKDTDEERRKVSLSKLQSYQIIEAPPDPAKDNEFLNFIDSSIKINDEIDNALLYCVYRDAIDFLITQDQGIHSKAHKLGLKERVLSIEEALVLFKKYIPDEKVGSPPALQNIPVYNLNINDPFFDSLKKEYGKKEFENWFKKISREDRKCWVYYFQDGRIGALLIYKIENEPIHTRHPIPARERLKLCTFKVENVGYKLGELFIKLSVKYCIKNRLKEIYLTHFTKENDFLVNLLEEYGFYEIGEKENGEKVFIKELFPDRKILSSSPPTEISKKYWPNFYDGTKVNKFIVPIQPKYHDRFFVECKGRQTQLREHSGEFLIEGNTITKAYICHTRTRGISKGDILLFYRSKDRQEITSIGVIEDIYQHLKDKDKIAKIVGKRTVYSLSEIEKMAEKPTTVILFRLHFHLPNFLKFEELRSLGVLKGAPQSVISINHEKYLKIKRSGGIDERFTVN